MRFGVLGTAAIGIESVIPGARASEHGVDAIASRDESRAAAVAAELDVPRAYGGYEALLADDALDAVYVPLPNGLHAEWIRRAADAGLHVLCEKPLTASAAETAAVSDYCDERVVLTLASIPPDGDGLQQRLGGLVDGAFEVRIGAVDGLAGRDDVTALFGEVQCDRLADAARGARDERGRPTQVRRVENGRGRLGCVRHTFPTRGPSRIGL
jgi:hypothetical protein